MATLKEISCKSAIISQSHYSYLLGSLTSIRSWESLKYLVSSLTGSFNKRLSTTNYNVNPYVGCTHKCAYCYVEYIKGRRHIGHEWGQFVDIVQNIPDVLSREISVLPGGEVFVGSDSDAYQPVEAKYKLTRQVIEILLAKGFNVTVLTKSSLVTRDVDILSHPNCKVGMTVTVYDDNISTQLEPGCSRTSERIAALKILKQHGVSTWVHIAPIIPTFTDAGDDLEKLIERFKDCSVGFVASDAFNPFPSSWRKFQSFLRAQYPERVEKIRHIVFSDRGFFDAVAGRIEKACQSNGLEYHKGNVN